MKPLWDFIACMMEHARFLGFAIIVIVLSIAAGTDWGKGSIDPTLKDLLGMAMGAGISIITAGVTNAQNQKMIETAKKEEQP